MKVLIMSHNPITDYNSMGKTFLGLFSEFSQDELCQFYIYPTIPNIKCCKSYYRITDKEALRSIIKRKNVGRQILDKEIVPQNTLFENKNSSKMYKSKESHTEIKILIRDIIWKFSAFKSKKFLNWLLKEKPDVIFAAPGPSGFFYNLILYTAKKLNIPIVTYVCDDFYFCNKNKKGIIKKIYAHHIRKKIKTLIKSSNYVITISNELAKDYTAEFNCKCATIFTGSALKNCAILHNTEKTVSYFGNLQLGRYKSLADVAKTIDLYNLKNKENFVLNIYTADKSPQISLAFNGISCARFCGFLSADKMYAEMKKASVLLHIESFESEYTERIKYSISTKIADSLASGVCLLGYGPAGIASIEYLQKNNCAFVATNKDELYNSLFECLSNPESRNKKVVNALKTANENHDKSHQSKILKTILLRVIKD